ncbi:hypothetical protein [Lentzea sp. NBRC 102530]|uniref:hypothetical protein n=1 Tax=Lentzea sp. NBRC 102530 TaxID=3032201 RepID=UPI0024A5B344|nr:hypothetical protein [Lentzea sp. NBRC 102530]GLY54825.1 hypothetical protein Lesp01_84800 [Lentzea sp. NBRC 102530]
MPQFKPVQKADPTIIANQKREVVRNGVHTGADHLSVTAMIQRLGTDEVRRIAAELGLARSARSVRRWRYEGRVPHSLISEMVKRVDQIDRMGGTEAAAEEIGVPVEAVEAWTTSPDAELPEPATEAVTHHDRAESRTRAGIPVDRTGRPTRTPRLVISGHASVKGESSSDDDERDRSVNVTIDEDLADSILTATESGDLDSALQAAEEYLSTEHAGCSGYGEDFGWHWESLDAFELKWD